MNETEATNGVAHFVEHMVFKATKKYGPGQIDREIEGLGAQLNGGTSKDWVHFYTTVASEHLRTALDVLADVITNAQFRPEDVEKERRVILDEIARSESNPSQRALDLLSRLAFPVHPYRLPTAGTRASVAKLSREDLVSYYSAHYTPANTCVAIAGDVSSSNAVALVKSVFRGFRREPGTAATDSMGSQQAPEEPAPTASRLQRFRSATTQAYAALGFRVPGVDRFKETCVLDVVLALLGDTYSGRVPTALARRGIRFSKITTDFVTQRDPGLFSVLVAAEPEDADKVLPVLLSEFHKLGKQRIAPHELANAKRLVEGSQLFEQETFAGQARALGLYESIGSHELALRYLENVRAVTALDVMQVASKYFSADAYAAVILEPEQVQQ